MLNRSNKNTKESIINRLNKKKNECQRLKIRSRKYYNQIKIKKKLNKHDYSLQELWHTRKRQNLRIPGVKQRAEIQTKGTENLFNDTVAENAPNLGKQRNILYLETGPEKNLSMLIVEMPRMENKKRILKAVQEKHQFIYKGKHTKNYLRSLRKYP